MKWHRAASLPHQLVLLPFVSWFAVMSQPRPFLDWLAQSWDGLGDGYLEMLWLYVFLGYMIKDVIFMELTLPMLPFWVHHVASIVISSTFLFFSPPGIFIVGGTLCEVGSATQSIFYLVGPKSIRSVSLWVHALGMSASNIGSVLLLKLFVFGQTHTPLPARLFFGFVSLLMFIGRQFFCVANVQGVMKLANSNSVSEERAYANSERTKVS